MTLDVIILCSGDGRFFSETLTSVLKQTILPTTIYVVDNGCSHTIYENLCQKEANPIIKYIKFENRLQMTANWQRCLEIGSSTHFICLHDDDLWDKDVIYRAKNIYLCDNDITACLLGHSFFDRNETDQSTKNRAHTRETAFAVLNEIEEPLRSYVLATSNLGHMSALFCKRRSFGYPIHNSYMPDQGFLANHAAYGKIAIDPHVSIHIRLHDHSITSSFKGNSRGSIEMIMQIRNLTLFLIENKYLSPKCFADITGKIPKTSTLRILQACHSWPLRRSLLLFGKNLLKNKPFKHSTNEKFYIRQLFGTCIWIVSSMIADIYYSFRENIVNSR
jgi:glycosyltransferase involved in cell wall biosynthesis